jgi:hypothetical protein
MIPPTVSGARVIRFRSSDPHLVPSTNGYAGSATKRLVSIRFTKERAPMYDMYPDWGPASHQPENPHSHEAVQASLDLRDNGAERPDDN